MKYDKKFWDEHKKWEIANRKENWIIAIILIGGFLYFAPGLYNKYIRSANIEDCADLKYTDYNGSFWSPKYIESSASEKLRENDELRSVNGVSYEGMWNDCEEELKNYPKKFKAKYKDARERLKRDIKVQKEWISKK